MTVRNRRQFESSQADRAAIAELLRSRSQADPLLSPKEICRALEWPRKKLRQIQRQVQAIRAGAIADVRRHLSSVQSSGVSDLERSERAMLDQTKLDAILAAIEALEARMLAAQTRWETLDSRLDAFHARVDSLDGSPNHDARGASRVTH